MQCGKELRNTGRSRQARPTQNRDDGDDAELTEANRASSVVIGNENGSAGENDQLEYFTEEDFNSLVLGDADDPSLDDVVPIIDSHQPRVTDRSVPDSKRAVISNDSKAANPTASPSARQAATARPVNPQPEPAVGNATAAPHQQDQSHVAARPATGVSSQASHTRGSAPASVPTPTSQIPQPNAPPVNVPTAPPQQAALAQQTMQSQAVALDPKVLSHPAEQSGSPAGQVQSAPVIQDHLDAANENVNEVDRDRLLKAIKESKQQLFGMQESLPKKTPRAVVRITAALDATPRKDREQLARHIRALGATNSAAAIDPIRDFTTSVSKEIRLACAHSLSQISHTSSYILLLEMLDDNAPEVVDEAIRSLLGTKHDQQIVPALLAAGSLNLRSRVALHDAATELDEENLTSLRSSLVGFLGSSDHRFVAIVVSLLSRIGEDKLIRRLTRLIDHDCEEVRAAVIDGLAHTEDKQVVRHINAAMKDESAVVRSTAAACFTKLRSPRSEQMLLKALTDPMVIVRRAAARTLSGAKDVDASEAASVAIQTETDPATIERLLEMLGRAGSDDAMDTLARYLASDDLELKHRAISTLRRLNNPKAVEQLYPLMIDSNAETRKLAVEAVGKLGRKKVCPRLHELLNSDEDESVRAACARALGDLEDEDSLLVLEEALHDSRNVKCQVVIALGQIANKSSIPVLMAQLKDAAPQVRYHACNALGRIGESGSLSALQEMLDDRDPMVRRGASAALEKRGVSTSGTAWLRTVRRNFRQFAANALPNVAAGGVPLGTLGVGLAAVLLLVAVGYGAVQAVNSFSSGSPGFSGPVSFVASAAINGDGSKVAILRERGVLEIWDSQMGTLASRFKYDTRTNRVMFADEDDVLLCTQDGLKEWHQVSDPRGTALADVSDDVSIVQRAVILPDGKTAYMFTRTDVNVVDLTTRRTVRSFQIPVLVPPSLTVGPAQRVIIYGDDEGRIHVLSATDGKQQQVFSVGRYLNVGNGVETAIDNLAFSHDGRYLAVSFDTGHLLVWDMEEATPVTTHQESTPVAKMAFIPGEYKLVLTNREGVHMLSNSFQERQSIDAGGMPDPIGIQLSADGQTLLAFADELRDVWVFDLQNQKLKHQMKGVVN